MDIKNDQEFNQWLKKNYACCECGKELFSFYKREVSMKYYVNPFQIESNERKKTKKCAECCKEKNDQWKAQETSLTKPVKEFYERYHEEKLRKTPIPVADQEKVIEFFKQKYLSPDLKCSQCGDYSVFLGEDEEGKKEIGYEIFNARDGKLYCAKHIKDKDQNGGSGGSSYLRDIWEEWKTSSFPPKSENPKEKNLDIPKNDKSKTIERNLKLENKSNDKNSSPLLTILTIALIIETLVIFVGITYWIIKKKAKK